MARVNLEFMVPTVVQAVTSLTLNDYEKHVSYAKIAKEIRKGNLVDTHGRDEFYNRVVRAVKLAVVRDRLRYVTTPIAGHKAQIALPFPFPDTRSA